MKEEEIRQRSAFNRYLELVAEDVKTIFADRGCFITINCPACGGKNYQPQFEKLGFNQKLPFTERLFTRLLMIPMNMSVSNEDINYISDCIIKFYHYCPVNKDIKVREGLIYKR